jgi:1-acyl-sn-glycerol-3-phosphate acyltransferase
VKADEQLEPCATAAPIPSARPGGGRTDWYWLRLPATGLCFLVFGIVTVILGVIVLPLTRLLSFDAARGHRRARRIVGGGLRIFVGFMRFVGVLRYSFQGREKLGRPGQVIIANHPTLIDVAFLLGFVPGAICIVKAGLFAHPVTSGAVHAAAYIPSAPADTMIHLAERALRDGECLLIFPEGTRTVPGSTVQLQRGASSLALRAASVLTPVFVSCDPPTLSKNEPWYRIPTRRAEFTLRVGEDIDLNEYRGAPIPIASRRLNSRLSALFTEANTVRDLRP